MVRLQIGQGVLLGIDAPAIGSYPMRAVVYALPFDRDRRLS